MEAPVDGAPLYILEGAFLYFLALFFLAAFPPVFCAANAPSEPTIAPVGRTTAALNTANIAAIMSFFTGRLRYRGRSNETVAWFRRQIYQDNS